MNRIRKPPAQEQHTQPPQPGENFDGVSTDAAEADSAAVLTAGVQENTTALASLRFRARGTRRVRDDFFQEWQAAKARRLDPSNAQSHHPSSWMNGDDAQSHEPSLPVSPPSSSASTPSTAGGFTLPSPPVGPIGPIAPVGPELDAQVAELMSRDRAAAVALALAILRHLPTNELAAELTGAFGDVPGVLAGVGSHAEQSTHGASSAGAASATSPPTRLSVAVPSEERLSNVERTQRCYCCDDEVGDGVQECSALRLLDSLESELELRDQIVECELTDGCDEEITHRGARWYMYRTFVAHKYGYLGVRVRIPDCVIAAIRSRYRAPGCRCDLKDIVTCNLYRGHRDS